MTSSAHDTHRLPADPDAATAALRALVATVERVQRDQLVDEFVALFRADAVWTTSGGGTPLYVAAKEDGRWLPAACQNTTAPDGEG
ncbi:hypothetical protein [Streptomyces sp. NPDC047130]|uniref:hypothetical protein n=1 Tax=Streptomyces sp. NPDC047130 TaxID=3155261 RepID=UPI0033E8E389